MFNPLSTHDLSKYHKENQEGREIYISHEVQPIAEQSDEESRRNPTGTTTPISSEFRGGYPADSSTTTPNPISQRRDSSLYDKSGRSDALSFPGFKDGDASQGRSAKDTTYDDKTVSDITGYRSYLDRQSNLTHTMRENSYHDSSIKSEESLVGSHLYHKHPLNNMQLSQLSHSIGPYDATASKVFSSPTIHERGPESEEESQNDSQLKISHLNNSPRKEDEI